MAPKPPSVPAQTAAVAQTPTPAPKEENVIEEDDLSLPVPEGSKCKRLGCGAKWQGEELSRGDGEQATCEFHPQAVSWFGQRSGQRRTETSPSSTKAPKAISAASVEYLSSTNF